MEGVVTEALLDRLLDDEDKIVVVDDDGEEIDESRARELVAEALEKTERYAQKAESVNQWVRR